MADKVPLKAIFTGEVPTALGEYGTGDTVAVLHGGTGATTAGDARTNLGLGDAATKNVGTTTGTVAAGNDSRLSDARTPTAHKTSHATGGSDALTAADIGAAATGHDHAGVYQPLDSDLTALAGLSTTGLIERTGAGTAGIVTVTTAGKNLLDDADTAAQRTTLGVGTDDSPQFAAVNVGHASDTTLARVSAGVVSVEGVTVATASNTLTLTNKTLTGLKETKVAVSAAEINLATGNWFTKTISTTTAFTVTNVPSSGTAVSFILDLTNGGSATVSWSTGFTSVKYAGGSAPTLTASGRDVLGFFTHDGGSTWTCLLLAKDVK